MDSRPSPSPSQSPSRTWHKQSGLQAATDGPLVLRGKDLIDRTDSSATMGTPDPHDSVLSPNAKTKKSPFKANVKVKRSQPTVRVPASASVSASGSGLPVASISTNTHKQAKTKASTTLQPTGVVKKRKSKSNSKKKSLPRDPPSAQVTQIPSTAPAPVVSAQPFTQVPKPRALPVEPDDSNKNMTSLQRFKKDMVGRNRRRDVVGDVGRTGRALFVTVKK